VNQPNLHNNGKYAMYITVSQSNHGPSYNIKAGEDLDPVKTCGCVTTPGSNPPEFKR